MRLFCCTGHVDKEQYDTSNLPRQLTEAIQILLLQIVLDRPGVMLHEIIAEIKYITETELTPSTICRFLHQSGFSRQRMRLAATQRDEISRATFASEVSLYNADMFIFVDETGTDRRDTLRRYTYSWRGKPAVAYKLLVQGQRLSSIAIMSTMGLLDCQITTENVDGDIFLMISYNLAFSHI